MPNNYENPEHNRFVRDMNTSRYNIVHFRGNKFWQGPAVECDSRTEVGDISSATAVKTIYEENNGRFFVHPESY